MDEINRVATLRTHAAAPHDESLARSRTTLMRRIDRGKPPRPRALLWAGGVVAMILVLFTLVFSDVIGLAGWRGGASPAAATVLRDAAANINPARDDVGPGQYLRVERKAILSRSVTAIESETVAFLVSKEQELYIPADTSEQWVLIVHPDEIFQTFGDLSYTVAHEQVQPNGDGDVRQVASGGHFDSTDEYSLAAQEHLPRDPVQLLNYAYRATLGQGNSIDGQAFVFFADRLRAGVTDPQLLAAFYKAIARIPGVTVTDDSTTLDGRTGVALSISDDGIVRREVLIDPTTGEFIGERQTLMRASGGLPAGAIFEASTVLSEVVDGLPKT